MVVIELSGLIVFKQYFDDKELPAANPVQLSLKTRRRLLIFWSGDECNDDRYNNNKTNSKTDIWSLFALRL